jgi:hypothetical protein
LSTLGDCQHWAFFLITDVSQIFGAALFHGKSYELILTKNGRTICYVGNYVDLIWSPWPQATMFLGWDSPAIIMNNSISKYFYSEIGF